MKYRRLNDYEVKKIMQCFCDDLPASTTAKILYINRNTINAYLNEFSVKILENSIKEHRKEFDVFELDESYFGARRIRRKRGRGADGKNPRFWLSKMTQNSVRNSRSELLKRGSNACNSMQDTVRFANSHRRLERI